MKVAVVGCGYWGINYVRLLSQLNEVDLVGICDANEERLRSVEKQFPGPRAVTDVEKITGDKEIEAVIVSTNPTHHYDIARRLIESGKHVLIEKPITTVSKDAKSLIDLAEKHRVILMVGHIFLFNEAIRKARTYIESREIGTIYYLYARRTNLGPIRPDVNALWDLAPHDISIFNYMLDSQPESVSVTASSLLNSNLADVGFINLHYPGGIIGHIHVSWADPHKVRQVVIVGSNLRIAIDDVSAQAPLTVYHKGVSAPTFEKPDYGEYKLLITDGDIMMPRIQASEPLKNQFLHFLESIENGTKPITDGEAGLQVVQVMEAIDESMRQSGAPITIASL